MTSPLVPCPACERHVRASERVCPFCDAALPLGLASRAIPSPRERLNRSKLAVFGATASLALAACGQTVGNGMGDSAMADGPVSSDVRVEEVSASDTGLQPDVRNPCEGAVSADYGAPPPPCDAGVPGDSGGPLEGGIAPPYGIPPSDGG